MESATSRKQKHHEAIVRFVLDKRVNGVVAKGTWQAAATTFSCSKSTVRAVFRDRDKERTKSSGRPKKHHDSDLDALLQTVPLNQRKTVRSTAAAIDMPASTLQDYLKRKDGVQRVNVSLKSYLTPENMNERLHFALSFVEERPRTNELQFDAMYDRVFIDEKWFYICMKNSRFYLGATEKRPHRTARNKNYITKVMFLCAVARPRYCPTTKSWWDGKLGIWPFVEQQPAQRSSKYRPKGTMETKCVKVNGEVYKDYVVSKLLPAIEAKWPRGSSNLVVIQQDNATPHGAGLRKAVCGAAGNGRRGLKIVVENQPPNSPDLNILDLGFFNSIQSLQQRLQANSVDTLIAATEQAFMELDRIPLEKCFLTLHSVMEMIMVHKGGNDYKIPHMGKSKMAVLPRALECSPAACQVALDALMFEAVV